MALLSFGSTLLLSVHLWMDNWVFPMPWLYCKHFPAVTLGGAYVFSKDFFSLNKWLLRSEVARFCGGSILLGKSLRTALHGSF